MGEHPEVQPSGQPDEEQLLGSESGTGSSMLGSGIELEVLAMSLGIERHISLPLDAHLMGCAHGP